MGDVNVRMWSLVACVFGCEWVGNEAAVGSEHEGDKASERA